MNRDLWRFTTVRITSDIILCGGRQESFDLDPKWSNQGKDGLLDLVFFGD